MTVIINQPVRQVITVKEIPTTVIRIKDVSPTVIKVKAQGPIGPRGEGIDDNTDFVMYYNLAKG